MNNAHLRLWPIVAVQDRYGGVYSGGLWLAAPGGIDLTRSDAHSEDTDAAFFADSPHMAIVGLGSSPDSAVYNLIDKTSRMSDEEVDQRAADLRKHLENN